MYGILFVSSGAVPPILGWWAVVASLLAVVGRWLALVNPLVIATLGFVAASLALFGILVPFDWWRVLAIASAVVSLLLVVIFWHPYLIVGLLIDAAVLVTLLFTKWSPR